MTKEGVVKAQIKKILEAESVYYFMPSANGYGHSAIPDFVLCVNGLFVGIEAKKENGQPTEIQQREARRIQNSGGRCICVNAVNVNTLKDYIRSLKDEDRGSTLLQ